MKFRKTIQIIVVITLLAACAPQTPAELPTPQINISAPPDVDSVVSAYLEAWQTRDYESMYQLLSQSTHDGISQEEFVEFFQETAANMTQQSVDAKLISASKNPSTASARYIARFTTNMFGEFEREIEMSLLLEGGQWRINWGHELVLPELSGGNRLMLEAISQERGAIYDRDGGPIAEQTSAYALAIIPNQIEDGREGQLLNQLSALTGRTPESIQEQYEDIRLTNWYVPVGEASKAEVDERWDILSNLGGLQLSEYQARYYFGGGIAPQAVGYVQPIPREQVDEYRDQGYLGTEIIGQSGLERNAEEALAGKPAASLYIVSPEGQVISRLNQADPTAPQNITTTIDRNLQVEAQRALLGFRGAAIVMEVETGRILAMASSPDFDPNLFEPRNRNSAELLDTMLNDGQQRLLNRAAQSAYPLGSVYKLIAMAAALESDLYTPDTIYYCGHYFEELAGERFKDWTLDKDLPPSGNLNLVQGLVRSCNPWFYHIGLDLFRKEGATYLADFSRGFGLGNATGIAQVAEDQGQIVDPASDGDAVQQGIGQGNMLSTPLQVVRFTAAIANGGTLYRPQMIERITSQDGVDVFTFAPEQNGTLPVSVETLEAIQAGMRGVVATRIGTAYDQLGDLGLQIYGKTGTAENPLGSAHAWFTGFSRTGRQDRPDIAVTVILENVGEGSEWAAPVFRRIMETYYFGEPRKLYPWEARFNITRTPTLEFTPTPEGPAAQPQPEAPSITIPDQVLISPTPEE
jgi:penicillin-binding protein 2